MRAKIIGSVRREEEKYFPRERKRGFYFYFFTLLLSPYCTDWDWVGLSLGIFVAFKIVRL